MRICYVDEWPFTSLEEALTKARELDVENLEMT